ncbi:MAG: ribbon-helix-helix domain-containing protein [Alphaproteobacteria bacterium]|nr:ribbon-helix-helix domain-containing protein [Alphaproteobacteria bacterium]
MNHNVSDFSAHADCHAQSSLVSKNITVLGRRTSIRLEPEMWQALSDIARREVCSIHDICSLVYMRKNEDTSLTAAIRVFLMLYFRAASTEQGHTHAGHGSFEAMLKRARVQQGGLFNSNKKSLLDSSSEKSSQKISAV